MRRNFPVSIEQMDRGALRRSSRQFHSNAPRVLNRSQNLLKGVGNVPHAAAERSGAATLFSELQQTSLEGLIDGI